MSAEETINEAPDAVEDTEAPETKPNLRGWAKVRNSIWFHLLVALCVLAVVQGFFVKLYQVPSGSMEQTLQYQGTSDRILVNRLAYRGQAPDVGDVVVFTHPPAWGELPPTSTPRKIIGWFGDVFGIGPGNQYSLVKRVLAGPGDTVECCNADGDVLLNGQALQEPYIYQDLHFVPGELDCTTFPMSQRCFPAQVIPEGNILVMGDHRSDSRDSVAYCRGLSTDDPRAPGCVMLVPLNHVVGEVFLVGFPFSRWGQELSHDPRP